MSIHPRALTLPSSLSSSLCSCPLSLSLSNLVFLSHRFYSFSRASSASLIFILRSNVWIDLSLLSRATDTGENSPIRVSLLPWQTVALISSSRPLAPTARPSLPYVRITIVISRPLKFDQNFAKFFEIGEKSVTIRSRSKEDKRRISLFSSSRIFAFKERPLPMHVYRCTSHSCGSLRNVCLHGSRRIPRFSICGVVGTKSAQAEERVSRA